MQAQMDTRLERIETRLNLHDAEQRQHGCHSLEIVLSPTR
jgi:hypothetical protein